MFWHYYRERDTKDEIFRMIKGVDEYMEDFKEIF